MLDEIRVLDLTRLYPGAYCSKFLADYGAEVIKIEEPVKGDYLRDLSKDVDSMDARFINLNMGKKSITLNLKMIEDYDFFIELVKNSDVLLEGFRPGVMNKLNLSYETLKEVNSKLIYCSLTGFGQTGPYADYAAHDLNILGLSGLATYFKDSNNKPVIPGIQISDLAGGSLMALSSILLALFYREKSEKGQYIDVSMLDGTISLMVSLFPKMFSEDNLSLSKGRLNGGLAYYNLYETKDNKWISVACLEYKFWEKFCSIMNRPEWLELHNEDENIQKQLKKDLKDTFIKENQSFWIEKFFYSDCCVTPVLNLHEVKDDPQINNRKILSQITLDGKNKYSYQVGKPFKMSADFYKKERKAPRKGQNNQDFLKF